MLNSAQVGLGSVRVVFGLLGSLKASLPQTLRKCVDHALCNGTAPMAFLALRGTPEIIEMEMDHTSCILSLTGYCVSIPLKKRCLL